MGSECARLISEHVNIKNGTPTYPSVHQLGQPSLLKASSYTLGKIWSLVHMNIISGVMFVLW